MIENDIKALEEALALGYGDLACVCSADRIRRLLNVLKEAEAQLAQAKTHLHWLTCGGEFSYWIAESKPIMCWAAAREWEEARGWLTEQRESRGVGMSDLHQELAEERRINAMSAEREMKLMSRLNRALDLLKEASDKLSDFGYEKTASKIDMFIEDVINDRGMSSFVTSTPSSPK